MRLSAILLCGLSALLLAAPPALATEGEPDEEPAWTLKWASPHFSPGDAVWFKVSWTNRSRETVQIPADLFERIDVSVSHYPSTRMARGKRGKPKFLQKRVKPRGPKANTLTWRTLPPGHAIEYHGRFADELKQCAKGCPPGFSPIGTPNATLLWRRLPS